MATMHPIDIENYQYTMSEILFYNRLKEQLSDKYHVFYSIRWFETSNDKRLDSECDFFIFDPSFGFITIEVKGGKNIEIENGNWILQETDENGSIVKRYLKCSPFVQAEKSMRHFYKYFSDEFYQTFNGVYGFAVAFPMYCINERISSEAPHELVIDFDDMNNLSNKINQIFHYWRVKRNNVAPFSSEQKIRLIKLVNKQISLSAAAGALIPIKEKEFNKINIIQDQIVDLLHYYKNVQVVGGAGTGKTFIAIKKLIREANFKLKCLFICNSIELSKYVSNKLSTELEIDCFNFEGLMLELLSAESIEDVKNGENYYFDKIQQIPNINKYDLIVVDEAQDFNTDMGLTIRQMLKDEEKSMLYVFYDKNQNIYDMKFENAFAIDSPPYLLRYNIRNTGLIYNYAVENTGLGNETIANSLMGVEPEVYNFKNGIQTKKTLTNIINNLIQKQFVSNSSIVVLSDVPYENSILNEEIKIGAYDITRFDLNNIKSNQVCFKTTYEFKGLEADIVIFLRHTNKENIETKLEKNNNYVALTRARYYLYILNTMQD